MKLWTGYGKLRVLLFLAGVCLLTGCAVKPEGCSSETGSVNENRKFRAGLCLTGEEEALFSYYAPKIREDLEALDISVTEGTVEELKAAEVDVMIVSPLEEEAAEKMVCTLAEKIPVVVLNHMPSEKIALESADPNRIYKTAYIAYDYAAIEEILGELLTVQGTKKGKCMIVSDLAFSGNFLFLRELEERCRKRNIHPEEIFVYTSEAEAEQMLKADDEIAYLLLDRSSRVADLAVECVWRIRGGEDALNTTLIETELITREEYEDLDR